jgi:hypothetical protein
MQPSLLLATKRLLKGCRPNVHVLADLDVLHQRTIKKPNTSRHCTQAQRALIPRQLALQLPLWVLGTQPVPRGLARALMRPMSRLVWMSCEAPPCPPCAACFETATSLHTDVNAWFETVMSRHPDDLSARLAWRRQEPPPDAQRATRPVPAVGCNPPGNEPPAVLACADARRYPRVKTNRD